MGEATVSRRRFALLCAAASLTVGAAGALAGCGADDGGEGGEGEAADSAPAGSPGAADAPSTRVFVDSLGREVEVPQAIERIAPSGSTAQQVVLTMAPERMVGLAQALYESQVKYLGEDIAALPVLGAAFGAKGDMNREAVAAAGAQIVIDTGEPTEGLAQDLDDLQAQLGIPVVFVSTPLDDYASAYRLLGDLLNMEGRAEELATYCAAAYEEVEQVMAGIPEGERVRMAFLVGDDGLAAIAKGSYQGTVVDMCVNNVVEVEKASGSGQGNEISLEQIALWDPEMIVFGPKSIYDTVADDPAWQGIAAIANDNYYKVPSDPWNWLNNPPTVNQVMGMQWLPRLCYPQAFPDDLRDVVTGYYRLFYGYELSDEEYDELTAAARPRTQV